MTRKTLLYLALLLPVAIGLTFTKAPAAVGITLAVVGFCALVALVVTRDHAPPGSIL
jgi:phosphotransferase system  glucose/maltose/N-acetylglucosamine-specific IIC component